MEFLSREVVDDGQQNVGSRRYYSQLSLSRVFLAYFSFVFGVKCKTLEFLERQISVRKPLF